MSRTRERYARMMATFWRNPRVRKLTDAAIATYCLALSYACDQLNDGILTPDEKLARHYLSLGAVFVAVGLDTQILMRQTADLAAHFKQVVVPAATPGQTY